MNKFFVTRTAARVRITDFNGEIILEDVVVEYKKWAIKSFELMDLFAIDSILYDTDKRTELARK